jgi:hypothetical protein
MEVKLDLLHRGREFGLSVYENRVQRYIFGSEGNEVRGKEKCFIRKSYSSALYS